jgi:hypothetical protein
VFGGLEWYRSVATGEPATTGTVMIATLPIILGFQLILSFLGFDMANEPRIPIQPALSLRDLLAQDRQPALPPPGEKAAQ